MSRDYIAMRDVLKTISDAEANLALNDFRHVGQANAVKDELTRLRDEGLIVSTFRFGDDWFATDGYASGLTAEGVAFYRLIENEDVWEIILGTLKRANVDVSYPLLKEVCEEIVKRYVTSFIPKL